MQKPNFAPVICAAVFAAACASSTPSPELVDARKAYAEASASQASTYAPDRLLEAKQALNRAEAEHEDDARSFEERRTAYVAERRAQIAQTYGDYAVAKHEEDAARRAYVERQEQLRRDAARQLETTRETLSNVRSDAQKTREELQRERQTRTRAEQRAAAAVASLKELATVKEEARGTVITLSGSVLFVTGQSELLPIAERKLESVAKALVDLDPGQTILIEGHTDARGAEDTNQKLSEERANAVRQYLIEKGVAADRVRTAGLGETQPIASNDTVEGRANNRRVEIIIQDRQGQRKGQGQTGTEQAPTPASGPTTGSSQ